MDTPIERFADTLAVFVAHTQIEQVVGNPVPGIEHLIEDNPVQDSQDWVRGSPEVPGGIPVYLDRLEVLDNPEWGIQASALDSRRTEGRCC